MSLAQKTFPVLLVLAAACSLCWVALYNGFPLVYPDTGTYMYSGFSGFVPQDRPIFYGFMLRHVSLAHLPFLVVLFQGLLVSWLLFQCFQIAFTNGRRKHAYFIITIAVLALFTGLSHNVSLLIPDVFTSIAVLAMMVYLFGNHLNNYGRGFTLLIFTFSLCTHFSNLLVVGIIVVFMLLRALVKGPKQIGIAQLKRSAVLTALFSGLFLLIPFINYSVDGHWEISGGGHVFLMGHLSETGIMKEYLDRKCQDQPIELCAVKDETPDHFVWSGNAPHRKVEHWREVKDSYNAVIKGVLREPDLLVKLVCIGLEYGGRQFTAFEVDEFKPQKEGSPPHQQIVWHYPESEGAYLSSKQNQGRLNFSWTNLLQQISSYLAVGLLLVSLLIKRVGGSRFVRSLMLVVLVLLIINPLICANLSVVDPRYQSRIVWMPVFAAMLFGFDRFGTQLVKPKMPNEKTALS